MYALSQDDVRQVIGNARFIFANRQDIETINEAIATASPEANQAMAVWDPQGVGYCGETVAFDLANVATDAIHRIRVNSTKNNPVSFTFHIVVGDYDFKIRGTQAHRGGDIVAKVIDRVPCEPDDDQLNEIVAMLVSSGGQVISCWDQNGKRFPPEPVPFAERSW
jgi:uncharacterized Zn-binding protein involved in type VI secretion